MWLWGLILGALIGSIGGEESAVGGAALGAVIGVVADRIRANATATAQKLLELEVQLRRLSERLGRLEAGGPGKPEAAVTHSDLQPTGSDETNGVAETSSTAAAGPLTVPSAAFESVISGLPPVPSQTSGATLAVSSEVPPFETASAPQEPSAVWRFLFGGNTLVRVGVLVLFFGVAFLLKYAADHSLFPIELRIACVAAGGIVLLLLGWRMRRAREDYALMLQGAGIGVLYLSVFASLRLYQLLPAGFAFALLAGIAMLAALLAIMQNAAALAITGAAGGFLAPILASTGGGSHVALFGFYAVLNIGIALVAYFKSWRLLNLVGFTFTFVIGLAWGAKYYRAEFFATTEPFLILFYLLYLVIAVLFAHRQAPRLRHYVDGSIVFGTPLVAFGLQCGLVHEMEFGAAWSAVGLAALYLCLATALARRERAPVRLLVEAFFALGVGFATLAIPLAFDGRLTSATWAVDGAAALWVGVRQARKRTRVAGLLLQLAAGIAFLSDIDRARGEMPVLNSFYIGAVMLSLAGLFSAAYLDRKRHQITTWESALTSVLFVWGALWWFGAGIAEIERHVADGPDWNAELLFCAGTSVAFTGLWRRLQWDMARLAGLALLPMMIALALGMAADRVIAHPLQFACWLGWAAAYAAHLLVLHRHDREPPRERQIDWLHAAGFCLLVVILAWECSWQIDRYVVGQQAWSLIAWAVVPGTLIAVFAVYAERLAWPISAHRTPISMPARCRWWSLCSAG